MATANTLLDSTAETIGNAFGMDAHQKKLVRLGLVVAGCYVVGRYVRSLVRK